MIVVVSGHLFSGLLKLIFLPGFHVTVCFKYSVIFHSDFSMLFPSDFCGFMPSLRFFLTFPP